ncbi:MAG TPA: DNA alkylation repair protein [bacterium]|nr:DNA alkylation repair protein [bacterium]HPS30226.1 DNA alkylation repair protein [bacterium]
MKNSENIKNELNDLGIGRDISKVQRFFKTGAGQYGEGDVFIGLTVPEIRAIAVRNFETELEEVVNLLDSEVHEHRLCGFLILVRKFEKTKNDNELKDIVDFYVRNIERADNWDLVDLSADRILGRYLAKKKDRSILYELAGSENLWRKRVSIVANWDLIKNGQLDDIYKIALIHFDHSHDLIRKAVGWMLREAGKKDKERLVQFLKFHYSRIPRTTLRYAIEKFSEQERKAFLKMS